MTAQERKEHIRLGRRWLNRKASKRQIVRCMELDRKAEFENRQLIFSGDAKRPDSRRYPWMKGGG